MGIDCATWYCVYRPMSPTMVMPMRWSSIFWSSSGSERFSTIKIPRAADLAVKRFGLAQVIGVNAEAAQTHGAELLVANGDGVGRSPVLVGLNPRGEEVHVGFEGRLKGLVPVSQVGEDRQRMRGQGVQSRPKSVRDLALVHK